MNVSWYISVTATEGNNGDGKAVAAAPVGSHS